MDKLAGYRVDSSMLGANWEALSINLKYRFAAHTVMLERNFDKKFIIKFFNCVGKFIAYDILT